MAAPAAPSEALPGRIFSLDVFRGFTMIWMFSNGFGLRYVKDIPWITPIERQFTHADWNGFFAWDMIQPFFMFIVGAAMPFSLQRRRDSGQTAREMTLHVLKRCFLLFLLGTTARSISAGRPVLDVINVLGQLAFTYFVAYLVWDKGWRVQLAAAAALLAIHWSLYSFLTGPLLGVPEITGPWDKNANFGWWLDGVILGKHWGGGYATINCISSAANTIFGVMAGTLLRDRPLQVRRFVTLGLAGIALGYALNPWIPINKKIWTASFAVLSTGITLLALYAFYWICDLRRWRRWAHVFAIVGANSIFIYLFHEVMHRPLWWATSPLFAALFGSWGGWAQLLNECFLVALQIAVCWLLYARKIFLRI